MRPNINVQWDAESERHAEAGRERLAFAMSLWRVEREARLRDEPTACRTRGSSRPTEVRLSVPEGARADYPPRGDVRLREKLARAAKLIGDLKSMLSDAKDVNEIAEYELLCQANAIEDECRKSLALASKAKEVTTAVRSVLHDIAAIAEDPIADERGAGVSDAFEAIRKLAERGL